MHRYLIGLQFENALFSFDIVRRVLFGRKFCHLILQAE